jgi:hypothetical protein
VQEGLLRFRGGLLPAKRARIVDDVVSQIQGGLELWPTLVEICYVHKHTHDLPKTRVANVRLGSGIG